MKIKKLWYFIKAILGIVMSLHGNMLKKLLQKYWVCSHQKIKFLQLVIEFQFQEIYVPYDSYSNHCDVGNTKGYRDSTLVDNNLVNR